MTHVCSPPHVRTIKTLAAALNQKWIVTADWLNKSKDAGYFVDETPFGYMNKESPLYQKKVFLSSQFENDDKEKNKGQRRKHCDLLIKTYGKGSITANPTQADIALISATEKPSSFSNTQCYTWEKFIDMIFPSAAAAKKSAAPSSSQ